MNNRNNRHNRSKSVDLRNMNNKDKKAFIIIPGIIILLFLVCSIFITKTVINSTANYIKTTATVQSTHTGSKQETVKIKNRKNRLRTKQKTVTYKYATITYKDTNNNTYTINKEYSMTSLKKGDKMTIYYNPDNPEKLKPEMSIFYIMNSIGVIFLLIYLCVICKFIIKSKK